MNIWVYPDDINADQNCSRTYHTGFPVNWVEKIATGPCMANIK